MNKKIIWLLIITTCLLLLGCSDFFSSSGNDDENTILWTKEQSPIYIEGCYVVPEGKTLMIQPGVEVRFKATRYGNDYNDLENGMLHVKGTIIARGSKIDSIVFTRDGDENRWTVICIDSTSTDKNIFQYCKMLHSGTLEEFYECCSHTGYGHFDCGAVFFHKSTGTIKDCYFYDNGSGVFCYRSQDVLIENNHFVDSGVDVFCEENTTAVIDDNTCINHLAGYYTPYRALWLEKSDINIRHNSFEGYYFTIYCAEMNNLIIEENNFGFNLFGIFVEDSDSGVIKSNIFDQGYYAICYYERTNISIINNLILNQQGGIACDNESSPIISNNTIVLLQDIKERYYGIGCGESSSPIIYNTIIKGYEDGLYIDDPSSQPTIAYSFIQSDTLPLGVINGGHNMLGSTLDPMFVDEENNNFQLQPNSPCVNAGYNYAPNLPGTDILGNPRISGPAVDIGAYEYQEP